METCRYSCTLILLHPDPPSRLSAFHHERRGDGYLVILRILLFPVQSERHLGLVRAVALRAPCLMSQGSVP